MKLVFGRFQPRLKFIKFGHWITFLIYIFTRFYGNPRKILINSEYSKPTEYRLTVALFCYVHFCSVLYCSVQYCTVLYSTVLYCTTKPRGILFFRHSFRKIWTIRLTKKIVFILFVHCFWWGIILSI